MTTPSISNALIPLILDAGKQIKSAHGFIMDHMNSEAGRLMTDMNGKPIDFSSTSPVIASNAVCYNVLLEATKDV